MQRNSRSLAEWVIMIGFGLLALSGLQRFGVSLTSWYWLTNAGVTPGPLYLALSGALLGLLGLLAFFWLLLRGRAYGRVVMAAALLFALIYWLDRVLISRADGLGANLVFAILVTIVSLLFTALVLRPWRKQ